MRTDDAKKDVTSASENHVDYLWRIHNSVQKSIWLTDFKALLLLILASIFFALLAVQSSFLKQSAGLIVIGILSFIMLLTAAGISVLAVYPRRKKSVGSAHISASDVLVFVGSDAYRAN